MDLLRRVGDPSQLGGILPVELTDGPERGTRAALVRSGSGLDFLVLLDRGMDIALASYQGIPLSYLSCTGLVAPAHFESQGSGWLRGFYAGLLTTCGLMHVGPPDCDSDRAFGHHDRASHLPAREVSLRSHWHGDSYVMEIQGVLRQAAFFGEYLTLHRRISLRLGEARLFIHDTVQNLGYAPTPHRILYHINAGYPLLDAAARLLAPARAVCANDAGAQASMLAWDRCTDPQHDQPEENYTLDLQAGPDGLTGVALVNPGLGDRGGLGLYIHYRQQELAYFHLWKMFGEGAYVLGMEPANSPDLPRERIRAEGKMPCLAPGEHREYEIEIGVLPDAASIAREEAWIVSLSSSNPDP
mgnify:CR=1 FL=1